MHVFHNIDATIADAVVRSLQRHLWYLTEELVVFGFFDSELDNEVQASMANALIRTPRPNQFEPGKPGFPNNLTDHPAMEQFVGPKSWLLFELLGNTGNWLQLPVDQWVFDNQYLDMKNTVNRIEVVNDAAERTVKDVQDYANAARDGGRREKIILVSNSHRVKVPIFQKNEMEEHL